MNAERTGWREDVLRQLDAASEDLFPGPPNENYPSAAVRLSGYTGEDEWLLVMQVLVYGRPSGSFGEDIYVFGNKISEPGFVGGREAVSPTPGNDFWSNDAEERFLPDLKSFSVKLGDSIREFSFSGSDLEEAGVVGIEMEPELAFIRTLGHHAADEVMLEPKQVLESLRRPHLNLVFRLDGWRQPDSSEGEKPSELPCFQAIADSIAAREAVGLDVCGATANTHWSHWIDFE